MIIKLSPKQKRIVYVIVALLVVSKIIYINYDKIENYILERNYKSITSEYPQVKSMEDFEQNSKVIKTIYFGSKDCSHCVHNINKIAKILEGEKGVYYFKVDWDDAKNQEELMKFQEKYKFETVPHIIIFGKDGTKSYSSKEIARYDG